LTAEQLQAARAAHWRQKQNSLLTLEDAERWLEQHPLCLYLPRRAQLTAPAPSFVEACMGSTQATPGAGAIEQAQELLTRLVATGSVVPLNLLGAVSEQPDFLAHTQALPYVLCLRADADWKHAPQKSSGHKVSPLVLELWKALDKEGVLSAAQARETLGRELTEAAILRGLSELWQGLRISPVYGDAAQPVQWELLRVRHRDALTTAAGTSQVTALSLLVSMYLQSVYAAASEEIEIFLSPVASRSRVREAVRGLSATRQIHSLSMDAQTYYFLEDGLPEFAALTGPPAESPAPQSMAPQHTEPPKPVAATMVHGGTSQQQTLPAPRRDRAQRPVRPATPLSRPPKPAPFAPRPGAGSSPARTEWTGPRRPAERPGRTTDKRPSRSPGRSFSPRTTAEPGAGVPRTGPRPDTRGRARPDARPDKRAAGGTGAERRERPAPWTRSGGRPGGRPAGRPGGRPVQGPVSAPRPPHAGQGGHSSFRDRPKSRLGATAGPGGDRVRNAVPGRPSSGRPPGRPEGRRPEGLPRAGGNRPWAAKGPPAAGRPQGRPGVPYRSGPNRTVSAAPRSGPPQGAGRAPGGGPGRGGSYDRPRPGGYAKTGARSGANAKSERGAQGARPPFDAGPRPSKSWPRASSASGRPGGKPGGKPGRKSGKPPARFRGGKPSGKKPGA
jgi:23S rRNA pseudouridine2605 synthase